MAVRDVLLRHAHEKNTFAMDDGALNLDREEFLCGSTDGRWGLGLPKDLLNEALAYWKGYEPFTPPVPKSCQVEDHACLLTAAGQTTDESRKEMAEELLAMQWVARKTLGAEPPAAQLRTLTGRQRQDLRLNHQVAQARLIVRSHSRRAAQHAQQQCQQHRPGMLRQAAPRPWPAPDIRAGGRALAGVVQR